MGKQLEGIIVAMITPMQDDESVDEAGLRTVTRFLVDRAHTACFPEGARASSLR